MADDSKLDLGKVNGIKSDKDNRDMSLTKLPIKRTEYERRIKTINAQALAAYKYTVKKRNIR